jgi:hypothetical protein
MSINQKERNRRNYVKNKELIKLASSLNQKRKKHIMFGSLKAVVLPADTIATLRDRFKVDETSETGLRWSGSSVNKPHLIGNKAGCFYSSVGYYYVRIFIGRVKYQLSVARVIWMMINNNIIEPGMVINHINRERDDNRIANLEVVPVSANNVNRAATGLSAYKNVYVDYRRNYPFFAKFRFLGKHYYSKYSLSEDSACIAGWEAMTSGKIPLELVKSQSNEWKDGTYLKKALAECKKQGIAVKRPKFKTLYEYIASVEGSC